MIPKTTTYKQFKEKKAKDAAEMEKGQRTLNGSDAPAANTNGGPAESTPRAEEPTASSPSIPRTPVVPVSALIADRTVEPSARQDPDVEMQE